MNKILRSSKLSSIRIYHKIPYVNWVSPYMERYWSVHKVSRVKYTLVTSSDARGRAIECKGRRAEPWQSRTRSLDSFSRHEPTSYSEQATARRRRMDSMDNRIMRMLLSSIPLYIFFFSIRSLCSHLCRSWIPSVYHHSTKSKPIFVSFNVEDSWTSVQLR